MLRAIRQSVFVRLLVTGGLAAGAILGALAVRRLAGNLALDYYLIALASLVLCSTCYETRRVLRENASRRKREASLDQLENHLATLLRRRPNGD